MLVLSRVKDPAAWLARCSRIGLLLAWIWQSRPSGLGSYLETVYHDVRQLSSLYGSFGSKGVGEGRASPSARERVSRVSRESVDW